MLHYRDLTQEQKDKISNGCGSARTALLIPNFIFEADCAHHDFLYWRGNTIFHKIKADTLFYYYMLKDVWRVKHYDLRLFYFITATLYYIIVSVLGIFFFNWRKQRAKNDLINL
jgi:hypothetical protein